MSTRNAESNQGDGGPSSAPAPPSHQISSRAGNTVFKSGPLFISSKGIGWTSWKKRWFILTRTSLVFFRSDPSIVSQRGSEVNLTLGGIDLNSSGSVVVKEDKKLLTVLFPDGRDGRAFTLKAETSEDLYDWKTALENALAQAPSAALAMGQNGIFRNDQSETASEPVEGGVEQWTERRPVTSMVVGRPILLALEDIDGTPSFLEKALTFIEEYGVKVEGILRQSADVDDVNRRVREYEEGKTEFSSEEDAHVIADCVKHVLRALPSSPVPASCCNALLEACKADRGVRINAMRTAVAETFPEPNRRLLQRILRMMQVVASHKSENRMSSSAVSACMAPLLLRPLLAGDCELGNDFTMGGDGSHQLLQAAAAANHAQAIVITLLEEYENIFGDFALQEGSELYTDSEESGSEGDEVTDDDDDEILEDDDETYEDEEGIDSQHNLDADREDEDASSGTISESSYTVDDHSDNKGSEDSNSEGGSAESVHLVESTQMRSGGSETSFCQNDNVRSNGNLQSQHKNTSQVHASESRKQIEDVPRRSLVHEGADQSRSFNTKSTYRSNESLNVSRRATLLGRTSARKNLSMESIDYAIEEDEDIEKLELTKADLQNKIAREVKENEVLHASLEDRKKVLHERRLALEQDVVRLREQLQKERDLRTTMEARLNNPLGRSSIAPTIDNKTKAELEEMSQAEEDVVNLKEKVADLQLQISQQNKNTCGSVCGTCGQLQKRANLLERQDRGENFDATTATSLRDRSRNSDDVLSRVDSGNVTEETPSLSRKQQSEKQQSEKQQMALTIYEGAKSVGASSPSSLPRKQQDEKQQRDLTVHDGAKSVGGAALSSLPRKQQTTSTVNEGAKSVGSAASSSLPRKQQSEKQQDEKQQMDLTVHEGTKSVGAAAPSSARKQQSEKQQDEKQQMDLTIHDPVGPSCSLEPGTVGGPNASIRKSGTKVEGTAGTSSALTKLTTRLNFLKERRSQIVSELQNIENNRSSDTHLNAPPSRTNSR